MAKLSYLQITNRILQRINQDTISDVTAATGHALIITQLINEAQNVLFTETNWYSLYNTTTFNTANGTAEYAAWESAEGRTISLMDTTNNIFLIEDYPRVFDMDDPDADYSGTPLYFGIQGANYRFHPIPDGVYTIRERYYKIPTTLSANADTSDLPIECENPILHWALMKTQEYLNKYEAADRTRVEYERLLKLALKSNKKKINRDIVINPVTSRRFPMEPVKFPSGYEGY